MVMLTSSRGCHSRRLSTTAAVLAASSLSTMRPYTSSGLAACSPPPHRSSAFAWVSLCPNAIAPSWVGSPLPPPIFVIFAHTAHVWGLTTFLLPPRDSSPVFLLRVCQSPHSLECSVHFFPSSVLRFRFSASAFSLRLRSLAG